MQNYNTLTKDPKLILVVDADNEFAGEVEGYLDSKSIHSSVSVNMASAVQMMSKIKFDIVLLNDSLPDADSLKVLDTINTMSHKPFVIMIVTKANPKRLVQYFECGIHDYVLEPVNLQLLWHKIRLLVEKVQLADELDQSKSRIEEVKREAEKESELAKSVLLTLAELDQKLPAGIVANSGVANSSNNPPVFATVQPCGNIFIFHIEATTASLFAQVVVLDTAAIVKTMAEKGGSLQRITHEIKSRLNQALQDINSVGFIGIEISPWEGTIRICNANYPNILSIDSTGALLHNFDDSESKTKNYGQHQQWCVIQAPLKNCQSIFFFNQALLDHLSCDHAEPLCYVTKQISMEQSWKKITAPLLTDNSSSKNITFCKIDLNKLIASLNEKDTHSESLYCDTCRFELTLTGDAIRHYCSIDIFSEAWLFNDLVCSVKQKAFTVLAELLSNAIDHGILKLDSSLKNDIDGFSLYLQEREQRLNKLLDTDHLKIQVITKGAEEIEITVEDSGNGYSTDNDTEDELIQLSGRGLKLVHQICDSWAVNESGNVTTVLIRRS